MPPIADTLEPQHPRREALSNFVQGKLDEAQSRQIEQHLEECVSCCEALGSLSAQPNDFIERLISAVQRGQTGPPRDDEAPPPQSRTPSEGGIAVDGQTPEGHGGGLSNPTASVSQFGTATAGLAGTATPLPRIGRFEIRGRLGHGGFGVVLLGYDPELRREVALKVPRLEALLTPELRRRFQREGQAAAALDHPHILPIYEAGETENCCYIASAYCHGPNLADWLKQRSDPVPFRTAAGLLCQLASAIQHAHSRGVLHRDLKPSNVLLELLTESAPDTEHMRGFGHMAKISDFGLARLDGHELEATRSNLVMGTASYMAPEQARGKSRQIGAAADIYSLGAILYELLTGRPPFTSDSDLETLQRVQHEQPVSPLRLRPKTPRDLNTICLKCLQKEPHRRYATAGELADDLQRYQSGQPILASPVGRLERLLRWCRRNPGLAAAGVLAAAALVSTLVVAVAFALYQSQAAEKLRQEQLQTQTALRQVKQERSLAEYRSAALALERGQTLCEQGKVGEGLLWLAQSLATAVQVPGQQAADLEWLARANLGRWSNELMPLRWLCPEQRGVVSQGAAFSADGSTLLFISTDHLAKRYDAATGRFLGAFPDPNPHGLAVYAISPDGRTVLISGRQQPTQQWDAQTGQPVGPPLPNPAEPAGAMYSADGRALLTVATDGTVQVFEAATARTLGPPLRHPAVLETAVFSPGAPVVATAGRDGTGRLWEVATGKPRADPLVHRGEVRAVAFSPDGRTIATASMDRTARLWGVSTGRPLGAPLVHPDAVRAAAFTPDGVTLVTGCMDGAVRFWDVTSGRLMRLQWLPGHGETVAVSPDGRSILTGGWYQPPQLRGPALGQPAGLVLRHQHRVKDALFSPDGRWVLTAGDDKTARLWDAATGTLIRTLQHPDRVLVGAFSPESQTIVTGCADAMARLWETATGQAVGPPLKHPSQVNAVAFFPDGRTILTGSADNQARLWDRATGQPLPLVLAHGNDLEDVAFAPDGKSVLTASSDTTAQMWEVSAGPGMTAAAPFRAAGPPWPHDDKVTAVTFSPDGQLALTASSDKTVRRWDPSTGKPLGTPLAHPSGVWAVAVSPDGRMILTGATDGMARLWDALTGRPVGPPLQHQAQVSQVAFSPDGRTILTSSYDQTARLWPMPLPVEGQPERIRLWVEVLSGGELAADGGARLLDAATWHQRREQLQQLGGPPP